MRSLLLLCLLVAGCNYVRPRLGSSNPRDRSLPGRGVAIDTVPRPPRPDLGDDQTAKRRRQCRNSGVPSGWVITSYEVARDCPGYTAGQYNAAILELLSPYRYNDFLTVCADQRVPGGWEYDAPAPGGCPGARVGEGEPTGMQIRKVR
jgi:hypothetical protein